MAEDQENIARKKEIDGFKKQATKLFLRVTLMTHDINCINNELWLIFVVHSWKLPANPLK